MAETKVSALQTIAVNDLDDTVLYYIVKPGSTNTSYKLTGAMLRDEILNNSSVTLELLFDRVKTFFVNGDNVNVTVSDANNSITIAAPDRVEFVSAFPASPTNGLIISFIAALASIPSNISAQDLNGNDLSSVATGDWFEYTTTGTKWVRQIRAGGGTGGGGTARDPGQGISLDGNEFDVNVGDGLEISNDKVTIDLDGNSLTKSNAGVKVTNEVPAYPAAATTDKEYNLKVSSGGTRSWEEDDGGGGGIPAKPAAAATDKEYNLKVDTSGTATWDEDTGGPSGSSTFTGLTDTPSSITANKIVEGNTGGSALEFSDKAVSDLVAKTDLVGKTNDYIYTGPGAALLSDYRGELLVGSNTSGFPTVAQLVNLTSVPSSGTLVLGGSSNINHGEAWEARAVGDFTSPIYLRPLSPTVPANGYIKFTFTGSFNTQGAGNAKAYYKNGTFETVGTWNSGGYILHVQDRQPTTLDLSIPAGDVAGLGVWLSGLIGDGLEQLSNGDIRIKVDGNSIKRSADGIKIDLGNGLEMDGSGNITVKLDGNTLVKGAAGIKLANDSTYVKKADLEGKNTDTYNDYNTLDWTSATDTQDGVTFTSDTSGVPTFANRRTNFSQVTGAGSVVFGRGAFDRDGETLSDNDFTTLTSPIYFYPFDPVSPGNYLKFTFTGSFTKVGTGNAAYYWANGRFDRTGNLTGTSALFRVQDRAPSTLDVLLPPEAIGHPPWLEARVGTGIELVNGEIRVKRDGTSITVTAAGIKVTDNSFVPYGALAGKAGDYAYLMTITTFETVANPELFSKGSMGFSNQTSGIPTGPGQNAIGSNPNNLGASGTLILSAFSDKKFDTGFDTQTFETRVAADFTSPLYIRPISPHVPGAYLKFSFTRTFTERRTGDGKYFYTNGTFEKVGTLPATVYQWELQDRIPSNFPMTIPWGALKGVPAPSIKVGSNSAQKLTFTGTGATVTTDPNDPNTQIITISSGSGPTGPRGPQGPKGDKGDQGDTGATGPQGAQGVKGDKGDKGDQGDQGERGPQGAQGIQGQTGPQGIQGQTGAAGPKGDTGDTGPKGDTGDRGPQGIQGIQGTKGDKGEKGDTGATGPQGPAGGGSNVPNKPAAATTDKEYNLKVASDGTTTWDEDDGGGGGIPAKPAAASTEKEYNLKVGTDGTATWDEDTGGDTSTALGTKYATTNAFPTAAASGELTVIRWTTETGVPTGMIPDTSDLQRLRIPDLLGSDSIAGLVLVAKVGTTEKDRCFLPLGGIQSLGSVSTAYGRRLRFGDNKVVNLEYEAGEDHDVIYFRGNNDTLDAASTVEVYAWNVGSGARGPAGPAGPAGSGSNVPNKPAAASTDKEYNLKVASDGTTTWDEDTGSTGPAGPQGPKGDKGDKGDTGATGPQGAQGPKGDKGDKGDTGATGPQGPAGTSTLPAKPATPTTTTKYELQVAQGTGTATWEVATSGGSSVTDTTLELRFPSVESTTVGASRQAIAEAFNSERTFNINSVVQWLGGQGNPTAITFERNRLFALGRTSTDTSDTTNNPIYDAGDLNNTAWTSADDDDYRGTSPPGSRTVGDYYFSASSSGGGYTGRAWIYRTTTNQAVGMTVTDLKATTGNNYGWVRISDTGGVQFATGSETLQGRGTEEQIAEAIALGIGGYDPTKIYLFYNTATSQVEKFNTFTAADEVVVATGTSDNYNRNIVAYAPISPGFAPDNAVFKFRFKYAAGNWGFYFFFGSGVSNAANPPAASATNESQITRGIGAFCVTNSTTTFVVDWKQYNGSTSNMTAGTHADFFRGRQPLGTAAVTVNEKTIGTITRSNAKITIAWRTGADAPSIGVGNTNTIFDFQIVSRGNSYTLYIDGVEICELRFKPTHYPFERDTSTGAYRYPARVGDYYGLQTNDSADAMQLRILPPLEVSSSSNKIELLPNSIIGSFIANASITEAKLANDIISTAKLKNNAVTDAKIADAVRRFRGAWTSGGTYGVGDSVSHVVSSVTKLYVTRAAKGSSDTTAPNSDADWLELGAGGSTYTGGDGISVSGTTIAVDEGDGLEISGGKVKVDLDGTSLQVGSGGLKMNPASVLRKGSLWATATISRLGGSALSDKQRATTWVVESGVPSGVQKGINITSPSTVDQDHALFFPRNMTNLVAIFFECYLGTAKVSEATAWVGSSSVVIGEKKGGVLDVAFYADLYYDARQLTSAAARDIVMATCSAGVRASVSSGSVVYDLDHCILLSRYNSTAVSASIVGAITVKVYPMYLGS